MAIAKVQSTSGASSGNVTSLAIAYGSNNTLGSLLIAIVSVPDTGVGNPTVTDSQGNTWVLANTFSGATGRDYTFAYALNCKAGANTVTAGFGSVAATTDWNLAIYEFSGVATTSAVDHSASLARYTATVNPTTTAFTASQNGSLYFGALTTETDPGLIVKDVAWTQGETPTTYRGDEYLVQSTAASLAADWTTTSARGSWFIYVFLPGASGTTPTVTTSAASSIAATTATGNGNVTSDGGSTITERGVVWATTSNPTTANSKATAAGTTGAYTASITGLTPLQLYHYRAYAINANGTSYGADTTFTTLTPSSFSDARQLIINGFLSAQNEAHGWNAEVRAKIAVSDVVRTSATRVTVTLDAAPAYAITTQEFITATVPGTALTGGIGAQASPIFTVTPSGGSGTVTSVTSLSRDIASNAGGATIIATCVGVSGTPTVLVNGVLATVTDTSSTTVTFTVPAAPGVTGIVTVTIGGKSAPFTTPTTFPFEYGAAYTVTLGRTGFENNAVGSADGQLDKLTTPTGGSSIAVVGSGVVTPHSGSFSCRQISAFTADNSVVYGGKWAQTDVIAATGRWHRWFVQFTTATLASVANNGQIKQFLSRTASNNFVVVGTGPETRDPAQDGINVVGVNNDAGNIHINDASAAPPVGSGHYGQEPTITPNVWHEVMVYERRDTSNSVGIARCWWDGKLIADTNYQNPANNSALSSMGSNTGSDVRDAQFGIAYTQNCASYPITEYLDDIFVGNGCIDPQDV